MNTAPLLGIIFVALLALGCGGRVDDGHDPAAADAAPSAPLTEAGADVDEPAPVRILKCASVEVLHESPIEMCEAGESKCSCAPSSERACRTVHITYDVYEDHRGTRSAVFAVEGNGSARAMFTSPVLTSSESKVSITEGDRSWTGELRSIQGSTYLLVLLSGRDDAGEPFQFTNVTACTVER